nr:hypothetical protein [Anaerolineae bacterium]
MQEAILLTIGGRLEAGILSAVKGHWCLRWPGGEVTFTPPNPYHPARDYFGDEALEQFVLEELAPRNIVLRICGTCTHFRFSGMSRDMSNGWVGYCLRAVTGLLDPSQDTTHLWNDCEYWAEDTTR